MAIVMLLLPAGLVGVGLSYITAIPWWATSSVVVGLQLLYHYWSNEVKTVNVIKSAASKYENLKYKQYLVPLICQACGKMNNIELDLTKTDFKCEHCEKENGVYVNFTTAVKSSPVYDPKDFLANVSGMENYDGSEQRI